MALKAIAVVLYFVVHESSATNFPPVENPVPIPAPAVKAPLNTPPARFLVETKEDNPPNQRWFRSPFIVGQSSLQRLPYNLDLGGYDQQSFEERSPVATPAPDDFPEASGTFSTTNIARKSQDTAPVILPSSDLWVGRKDTANQYVIQRWIPPSSAVLSNQNVIKGPETSLQGSRPALPTISFRKDSGTTAGININPAPPSVKQVWMNGPRIYTSLQSLLQDLPAPNQVKRLSVPSPPQPQFPSPPQQRKSVVTQSVRNFPSPSRPIISNKGSDMTNLYSPVSPKIIQVQNGNGALPSLPSTPLNLRDAAAVNAWILSLNAVPTFMRQPDAPTFKISPGFPVPSTKGPEIVDDAKSSIPAVSPKINLNGNSWVIKQGERPQTPDDVPLTFTTRLTGKSKNLPTIISQPKLPKFVPTNPPAPLKSFNQGYVPSVPFVSSIVFRRGNANPKFSGTAPSTIGVIPHSPKSDVMVIGKGSTIAHLAPQKNILIRGPLPPSDASKPCVVTADSSVFPKDKSAVIYPQQFRMVPSASKVMPTPNRNSFYFIWNPTSQPNVPVLPQIVKQNTPSSASKKGYPNTITMPLIVPQNRFQYPLRYIRPNNVYNPVPDISSGKYGSIGIINKGTIAIPFPTEESRTEGEVSSSKENKEQKNGTNKEEKREELKESETAEAPASIESSEEAETPKAEKYEESPDNIKLPSEQKYSFLEAPKQMSNSNSEKPIIPYSFKYDQLDKSGASHHREESSDISGKITGNYGFQDKDGTFRNVDYVADNNGFRAKIHTNENGVISHNSADANVVADSPPSKQEDAEKTISAGITFHTRNTRIK